MAAASAAPYGKKKKLHGVVDHHDDHDDYYDDYYDDHDHRGGLSVNINAISLSRISLIFFSFINLQQPLLGGSSYGHGHGHGHGGTHFHALATAAVSGGYGNNPLNKVVVLTGQPQYIDTQNSQLLNTGGYVTQHGHW